MSLAIEGQARDALWSLRRPVWWLVLVIAASAVLLPRLGARSLADWDEAIYAQVAREMLEERQLFVPWRGGEPFFEKPPLYFWFTIGCYLLGGVSEATARLGSALSGIGLVAVIAALGSAVGGRLAGVLAPVVLLTSAGFVVSSRSSMLDVPLAFATWAAVAAFLRAREGSERHWNLAAGAVAAAVMLKSAAGLVAPLAIAATLALDGGWRTVVRSRAAARAAALFVALVAPWHLAMVARYGAEFAEPYFGYHLVARAFAPLETHVGGPAFYLRTLPTMLGPWIWLLPVAFASAALRRSRADAARRLVGTVGLTALLLVLLVRTRIAWYLVPVLPALALVIGTAIDDALRSERPAWLGALWLSSWIPVALAEGPARASAAAVLVAGVLSARLAGRAAVACGIVAALSFVALATLRAHFDAGRHPVAVLASAVAPQTGEAASPLVLYAGAPPNPGLVNREPSALYYGRRPVRTERSPDGLRSAVADGARYALLSADAARELSPALGFVVLAHDRGFVAARLAPRPEPLTPR